MMDSERGDSEVQNGRPVNFEFSKFRRHKPTSSTRKQSYIFDQLRKIRPGGGIGNKAELLASGCRRFGLHHIVPLTVLVVYTILGGVIFSYAERANDVNQTREGLEEQFKTTLDAAKQFVKRVRELELSKTTENRTDVRLKTFEWFANKVGIRVSTESEAYWDMWGSMHYAGTLYTTIGIPLVLIILADVGKVLFKLTHRCWALLLQLFAFIWRIWRLFGCKSSSACCKTSTSASPTGGDQNQLPIYSAVIVLLLWLCTSAGVFAGLDPSLSYFEAFYFVFISLTTIGLGDIVPRTSFEAVLTFPLVIMGMSVISMCINIIQDNIELLFKNFMQSIARDYLAAQTSDRACGLFVTQIAGDVAQKETTSADVMELFENKKAGGVRDKLLMKLMNKQQREQLQESYNKHANLRNQATQTQRVASEIAIQAGNDDFFKKGEKEKKRPYIYSVT